jgi:hypothetical protein
LPKLCLIQVIIVLDAYAKLRKLTKEFGNVSLVVCKNIIGLMNNLSSGKQSISRINNVIWKRRIFPYSRNRQNILTFNGLPI